MKKDMPSGLKWMNILSIIGIVFASIGLLFTAAVLFFYQNLELIISIGYQIITLAFAIILLLAISKRNYSLYKTAIYLLYTEIILYLVGQILPFFLTNLPKRYLILSILESFFQGGLSVAISVLFLWYLFNTEKYFKGKEVKESVVDKRFKALFLTFLIAMISISIVIGIVSFGIGVSSEVKYSYSLNGTLEEGLAYCETDSNKDECYAFLASLKQTEPGAGKACERIEAQTFKDGCYLELGECNKIEHSGLKSTCEKLTALSNKN